MCPVRAYLAVRHEEWGKNDHVKKYFFNQLRWCFRLEEKKHLYNLFFFFCWELERKKEGGKKERKCLSPKASYKPPSLCHSSLLSHLAPGLMTWFLFRYFQLSVWVHLSVSFWEGQWYDSRYRKWHFFNRLWVLVSQSVSIYEEGSKTISYQDTKAFIPACLFFCPILKGPIKTKAFLWQFHVQA